LGNLFKSVPLEEVKPDGLLLFRGKPGGESCHQRLSKDALHRSLVERKLFSGIGQTESGALKFRARLEVAGIQVTAPVKSPVIGHMNDPGAGAPVR